ncbi:MAG: hypothetical protein KJ607_05390 [Bacteroidetes bacterium]|nr:hypothetical protein [Bacteroidota bacterium]
MNRIAFTLTVFAIRVIPGFAQTDMVLHEQFSNNNTGWFEGNTETYSVDISKGYYRMTHKTTEGSVWAQNTICLRPDKDYYVETSISLEKGSREHGFGFYLHDERRTGHIIKYYFNITGNGYFRISKWMEYDDEYIDIVEWTKTDELKTGYGEINKLAVKKSDGSIRFYINDKEVQSLTGQVFWGSKLGFITYNETSVKIDYAIVKQDGQDINLIGKSVGPVLRENLGNAVNTEWNEIMPVISTDGNTLYFDVKDDPANIGEYDNDDIWYAVRAAGGKWKKRINAEAPLNNNEHNFVISIAPDNNTLLLYGQYTSNGAWKGEGLSMSTRNDNGWSVPEDVVIEDYYTHNKYFEFCMAPDRKALILSLERDDGYGGRDLYVSFIKEDGTWTIPRNMGEDINSFATEFTPYIAADGKTLYFSSYGHPGYGSADIFMSKKLDDNWLKWSKPVNPGQGINTGEWDAYFTIPASGEWAYLSSADNSTGLSDIFRLKVPDEFKPEPVVLIYGKVIDSVTMNPVKTRIDYSDNETGKELGFASSSPADGSYIVVLPAGKEYNFEVKKKNYHTKCVLFDVRNLKEYREFEKDIYLMSGNEMDTEDKPGSARRRAEKRETVAF